MKYFFYWRKQNILYFKESEGPLDDVEVLFPDPDEGQVVGQDVDLRHHDLVGVGQTNLVQVKTAGIDNSKKRGENQNRLNVCAIKYLKFVNKITFIFIIPHVL